LCARLLGFLVLEDHNILEKVLLQVAHGTVPLM
jgi:hypothetical protein